MRDWKLFINDYEVFHVTLSDYHKLEEEMSYEFKHQVHVVIEPDDPRISNSSDELDNLTEDGKSLVKKHPYYFRGEEMFKLSDDLDRCVIESDEEEAKRRWKIETQKVSMTLMKLKYSDIFEYS